MQPFAVDGATRRLADSLPRGVRLGTSSWAFPGWRGIVYAEDTAPRHLSRHGLAAYSRHPLLTAVGIDRTFYAPITALDFADYAAAVPDRFRFLVKAWSELTSPVVRGRPGTNARYLDVDAAIDAVLAPAVEGLGERLGPPLFQFPPQGAAITRRPDAFADRVYDFFSRLPTGAHYAVELRDEVLFSERYADALAAASARHCYSVHPRMPLAHASARDRAARWPGCGALDAARRARLRGGEGALRTVRSPRRRRCTAPLTVMHLAAEIVALSEAEGR